MNYILCGFKNCGKTSVGKLLATHLNYDFIDIDDLVKNYYYEKNGIPLEIHEIVKQYGETEFRDIEKQMIQSLSTTNNSVIATGGGSMVNPENAMALKKLGKIIYITVNKALLKARTLKGRIPTFLTGDDPGLAFDRLYEFRAPIYQQFADIVVDGSDKTVEEILLEVLEKIKYFTGAQHGK